MLKLTQTENQILCVTNFEDLVGTPFHGSTNVICWSRNLIGDFAEIVNQIDVHDNMVELHTDELLALQLSVQGQIARDILLNDLKCLEAQGASPTLNLIKCYEIDDSYPFLPTDVYSFHVDRAPIESDTILCTYYGETSEILPKKKKKLHDGSEEDFESFLTENFFDLHYQAKPEARPIKLELGHMCRLAIDHPESKVLPCLHRAPKEKDGRIRLLLIC